MKLLLLSLFLVSCATTSPCKYVTTEEILGVTYSEYKCTGYSRYCRKFDDGRTDCFVKKNFSSRNHLED
jgi:hypothetical protein